MDNSSIKQLLDLKETQGYLDLAELAKYYNNNTNAYKMLIKATNVVEKSLFINKKEFLDVLHIAADRLYDEIFHTTQQ